MLTFNIVKSIYDKSKLVDKEFIKWGLNRGFMTLRMSNDKIFSFVLKSVNNKYNKSLSHKIFFTDIMNFPIKDNINFNNSSKLTITMFPSNKHGFKKELIDY